jgi:GNAT superfamily N-acetyltransferase
LEFRVVGPYDAQALAEVFSDIDDAFFRPHPFTHGQAQRIANYVGRDVYALLIEGERPVAYGMLRGWDEGHTIPSLGIAVRTDCLGRGLGRMMMAHLHAEAARRGATGIRLRVYPDNVRARRLYESLGYAYTGQDRDELVMLVDVEQNSEDPADSSPPRPTLRATLLDVDAPEWEAVLRAARHDFYHLPAYVALCAVQERGQPRALYVTEDGNAMLLPLVIRDIPGGGFDATSPYGYPGPVGIGSDDPAFLSVALAAGVQALREADLVSAFVRLHPLLNPLPLRGIGTFVRHGETVSIDLTLPIEELWAQTRLTYRREITRALGLGYVARMDEDWRHLESFRHLYRATMDRHSADPFYFFEDAYFDDLRDALGESLHLCVVEKDGAIAAAGLFVETDGIVQYHLSGTDDAFRMVQPTKLMIHFVRGWAKDRGNLVLHLGGGVGGDSDSLLFFKSGFSSLRHTFATLRIVIDEGEYGRLLEARDPLIDPAVRSGYFPLYRQA